METLGIVAALAVGVQTAALVIPHRLPTGYNPIRDAVSDYVERPPLGSPVR